MINYWHDNVVRPSVCKASSTHGDYNRL